MRHGHQCTECQTYGEQVFSYSYIEHLTSVDIGHFFCSVRCFVLHLSHRGLTPRNLPKLGVKWGEEE